MMDSMVSNLLTNGIAGAFGGFFGGVFLFVLLFTVVALFFYIFVSCKVFIKAGRQWWEAIIPFYNLYVLVIIAGLPWWSLIFFFVPFLSVIVSCIVMYKLSERFGYGIGFTLGLIFLPFIFLPILAFDNSVYRSVDGEEVAKNDSSVPEYSYESKEISSVTQQETSVPPQTPVGQ